MWELKRYFYYCQKVLELKSNLKTSKSSWLDSSALFRQCNMPRRWWPTSYTHYFLIGAWSKYWLYYSPPFWWNLLSHSSLEMVLLEWQSRLKIDIEAAILGAHQTYFFNACGMCPFSPYFYPKKLWQIVNI